VNEERAKALVTEKLSIPGTEINGEAKRLIVTERTGWNPEDWKE
jgi:hypothetical protein